LVKPSLLEVIDDVKYVKAGIMSSFVVTKEGKLYSTGSNKKGEIGHAKEVPKISKLTLVDTPERVRKVECGLRHAVMWLEDGRVMGCGSNKLG
jgi:alpha-tubulin suppressor-like RCC1 family protein